MSKTVFRYDRKGGELKSPTTTPQGFLRCDGYPARAGIYKYRRDDGTIQYERRPPEEVFHADSLASYDDAPLTIEHPAEGEVNADNVRRHEVGHVKGAARQDGDRVATEQIIKDARAIKQVKAGKQQLSPGYKIELDETPGHDSRYATPDNPTGRYDATQTKIRVNHLAIVDNARGGSQMRLRMDDAELVLDSELDAKERHALPAKEFAVPDKEGLPIQDEAHVRAAMSRFNQYDFADDAEKKAAYGRIVRKAKALGIDSSDFEEKHRADASPIAVGEFQYTDSMFPSAAFLAATADSERADTFRADIGGGGGNPNHDNKGRFAAGHSATAHGASATAKTAGEHANAAHLHEQAAAAHHAAGNGAVAQAHTLMAQHHKGMAAEAGSGHTGPGYEHSERAMAATNKAYQSKKGSEHADTNRAAAEAHETAAAVHAREGNAAAAAEHRRMAGDHRGVVGTDLRVRPGMMSSPGTSRPAPPPKRHEPPKVSDEAKAAAKAAESAKWSMKSNATAADHTRVAKLFEASAEAHRKSGDTMTADYHDHMAKAHRDAAAGVKEPVRYRGDADRASEQANATGRAVDHRRAAIANTDAAIVLSRTDSALAETHRDRARAHDRLAERAFDDSRYDSSIRLTTAVDGHQHSVDLDPPWGSRMGGQTSCSVSSDEKSEHGHCHDWIRNMDGTITIGMAEGHTHELIDSSGILGYPSAESMAAAADSAATYSVH